MNLILLQDSDFIDKSRVRLYVRRYLHIKNVLGASHGKTLQVGLLNGKTGTGSIVDIGGDFIELEVELIEGPPASLPISLILAMPRPKVFKRVLQGVTALGIKNIILLNTWRVDKSYWQTPALKPEALREQCILGLEQSRDTILPIIDIQTRFKPFVEDILPKLCADSLAFVAHPGAQQSCPVNIQKHVTLAVGPEGGFTDYELRKLEEAGMISISLSQRALRVETAIPALLGRLLPAGP